MAARRHPRPAPPPNWAARSGAGPRAPANPPRGGAYRRAPPGPAARLALRPDFEHALLVLEGALTVSDIAAAPGPLLYLGSDRHDLRLTSDTGAHAILIGGAPFGEDLVMWWNFVARSHEEIRTARNDWENHDLERFPDIAGHTPDQRIPAPPLPNLRLQPRKRRIAPGG
ncbi:pirin-like C-terminal cupin domain-containing protein [Nocardia wallacei]|uniref:pirin-like C-terminal cupin domain-containing protein n=1 Tax=Nocardia wallacei TaxID=480035 RepID=UPI002458FAB3|nr:pirin-like C-terminal cupin domain-containing protein [Nocardia wallacei]